MSINQTPPDMKKKNSSSHFSWLSSLIQVSFWLTLAALLYWLHDNYRSWKIHQELADTIFYPVILGLMTLSFMIILVYAKIGKHRFRNFWKKDENFIFLMLPGVGLIALFAGTICSSFSLLVYPLFVTFKQTLLHDSLTISFLGLELILINPILYQFLLWVELLDKKKGRAPTGYWENQSGRLEF